MHNSSIRARMTRGFAIYTAVLMLTMCAVYFFSTQYAQRHAANHILHENEKKLEYQIKREADISPQELILRNEIDWAAEGTAVLVVDDADNILARTPGETFAWPLQSDSWHTTTITYHHGSIVIGVPWESTERKLRHRTLIFLLASIFIVAALAAGAWIAVGRTLSPLDGLTEMARQASSSNLQLRLESPSQDEEMLRLVKTINDLLSRQEETMKARGRFYAAAAHELRTPLQALTGHLELALDRERSVADYQLALREGHTQAEQLTNLVQGLLLLNQLETNAGKSLEDQLDLADICETELASLQPLILSRGVTIKSSFADDCEITAPWSHAKILLRNLLENAIKYATPGSTVKVELDKSTFMVWNECVADEENDPEKYFEPFYRPDESRNSEIGGNGLGLAICKGICEANGWHIRLVQADGGMRAQVEFSI